MQIAALNKQELINPGINKNSKETKKDLYLKEHFSTEYNLHFFDINIDAFFYRAMFFNKGMTVFFDSNVKVSDLKNDSHVLLINKKSGSIIIRKVELRGMTYTLEYFVDGLSDNYIPMDTKKYDLLGKVVIRRIPRSELRFVL